MLPEGYQNYKTNEGVKIMFNNPVLFWICVGVLLAVTGCVVLLIQTFLGKNQIILKQKESLEEKNKTISEIREIKDAFVEKLKEEQFRRDAVTSLYEKKCIEYDELHALCLTDTLKKKGEKFASIDKSINKTTVQKETELCTA
jgi:hypothetical protein